MNKQKRGMCQDILTHATTWVNLEDIMPSKRSQSQKDKHCMIPFIEGVLSSQSLETK